MQHLKENNDCMIKREITPISLCLKFRLHKFSSPKSFRVPSFSEFFPGCLSFSESAKLMSCSLGRSTTQHSRLYEKWHPNISSRNSIALESSFLGVKSVQIMKFLIKDDSIFFSCIQLTRSQIANVGLHLLT